MNGDFHIDVNDFGPIAEASMDVRPLTVLIGPSNTGKSYFAILLYALHQSLSHDIRVFPIDSDAQAAQVKPVAESLRNWFSEAKMSERLPDLPRGVTERIRSLLASPTDLCGGFAHELRRCFGATDLNDLIRRVTADAKAGIGVSVQSENSTSESRYGFRFKNGEVRCSSAKIFEFETLPQDLENRLQEEVGFVGGFHDASREIFRKKGGVSEAGVIGRSRDQREFPDAGFLKDVLRTLTKAVFECSLQPLRHAAYYLPADRTGVMHSHHVVMSTLVQNATTAGLSRSTSDPLLSGVLADFFNQLIGLSTRNHTNGEHLPGLAQQLEAGILKGTVRLDCGDAGYPAFAYRPTGWTNDLPLMRASSMVSELAPVVLYLRHLVKPGDVLIIEEPEAHLHPAAQTVLARELARLVCSGIRVVMTTHSEWFLEQIGNLIRVSKLPADKRQGIAGADVALEPDSVGAWLFKPLQRANGSVVEEIVPDPETGLFPTDYDPVSEALYNDGAEIFNRLQDASA